MLAAHRDVQLTRTLALPLPEAPVALVAWRDVGAAAAAWLASSAVERGDRAVRGPDGLTGPDLAAGLTALLADITAPRRFAALRLRDMDADGDGVITLDEAARFLCSLGQSPEVALAQAQKADLDGDGSLSLDELVNGLEAQLARALSALPTAVAWHPTLPHLAVDRWAAAGRARAEARGLAEHLRHTASAGAPAVGAVTVGPTRAFEALAPHALSFVNLYILPGRGLMSVREGHFGDAAPAPAELLWDDGDAQLAAVATLSHLELADGSRLDTRRAVTGAVEARWQVPAGATEVLRFGEGDDARAIELAGDRVVGVACRGRWAGLRGAMHDVMERRKVQTWERALFRELGALELEHIDEVVDPDEVVCHCANVKRRALVEAADGGATTVAMIAAQTCATTICGGCTPLVEEILGSPKLEVAAVLDLCKLGDGFVRLTITPAQSDPAESLPGQHIVVQARIHERWATRAYTLTSPGGAGRPYEITVKREEMGLFSRWLADRAHAESLLRVSKPAGSFCLAPDESGPVYMFAGGIGVTPGVALARTLASDGTGRALHIDWSARREADFIFEGELNALAAAHPNLQWTRRLTSRDGRIDAAAVRALYRYTPGAVAFLCGPDRYVSEVRAYLYAAGWPEEAVRVELFSSKVDDEGHVTAARPHDAAPAPLSPGAVAPPVQHTSFFLDLREGRPVALEAEAFLGQMYRELGLAAVLPARLAAVRDELARTGTYTQTTDELTFGARLAWRNATRCVGRFFWNHLVLRDMRHLEREEDIFHAIVDHMRAATNGGDLVSTMTVFRSGPPTIRLFNSQLVRYAGYREADGRVRGDPANVELTEHALALGWKGAGTAFDVLPIIVQVGDRAPRYFDLPDDAVLQVPLEHPSYPWFAELGLKWYALPAVSEIALDVGGVQYRCAPFNGFYMVTEIGARNLSDPNRYNLLPVVAERLGLDTKASSTLWKDRAMVELSIAVMHSFQKRKVRMLDHHAMSEYFLQFEKQELAAGRCVYGDWSWLVPPLSGSASPLWWRNDLENVIYKPMYGYQRAPWEGDAPPPAHEGPVPPCPHLRGRLR